MVVNSYQLSVNGGGGIPRYQLSVLGYRAEARS
jgi:hypothetical protein